MTRRGYSSIFILILFTATACHTVAPAPVLARTISFDGTSQTAGLISYDKTTGLGLITPTARARYNALIALYGQKFLPPLLPDSGLVPVGPNYQITAQALANFATMTRWHRSR